MTDLEEILERNWNSIFDRIVNSRKRISAIKREFGLRNGLVKQRCIEETGYAPEELRVVRNLDKIEKMMLRRNSVTKIRECFNVGPTAINRVFRQIYGVNAKQYLIEQKARQTEGYKMKYTGTAKIKGESGGKRCSHNFNRYRAIIDKNKKLADPDNRYFED
ncbi:hypothetical protein KY312_00080 [Candidatus Woesearchaeota archaeon]|nr:hypothetical protein [Candidatus Woesearchaeota archaeon]